MTRRSTDIAIVCAALWVFTVLSILSSPAHGHDITTFERDILPIVSTSCGGMGCHIDEETSGVEMTSFESLMASTGEQYGGPVVVPGDPDASPIMDKINSAEPRHGARMPYGQEPLDDIAINTFRKWIREGALSRHVPQHGDANSDDILQITDAIFLLTYLFQAGEAPDCEPLADGNGDGDVNLADAVFVLNYLFNGGEMPTELSPAEEVLCEQAVELTFADLYEKVFARSCAFASCHSSEAQKGQLSLGTIDEAYEALVGADPFNDAARAAGQKRVDAGIPDNSFLMRKLTQPGPGEGNRMPASSPEPLDECAVDAIREWILAGAPRESSISGVAQVCEYDLPSTERLAQPPVPENGVQLHLPPFSVAPGTEREIFYFAGTPFANLGMDEVVVQRIDIHMLESSHHFIIYEWIGGASPASGIRPVGGVVDILTSRRFVVGSQQSFFTLAFPEGVGIKFTKNTRFDLNSHYLNLSGSEVLRAEVYINFFFAEPDSVDTFVKPIFEINPNISVPPLSTRTTEWFFPGPVGVQMDPDLGGLANVGAVVRPTHVYSLSSHMHRHGDRFTAYHVRNGQDFDPPKTIYDNFDWDDPVYSIFDPPFILNPGEGIRFTTTHTYEDPPSANSPPLTFDVTSEDEMAILLGYYAVP